MWKGRDSITTKATNKVKVKCFSLKGIVPLRNISLPSPTLLSMGVLTHAFPLLKHLFSKIDSSNLRSGRKIKKIPTCLETTYKRSNCLVHSKRVHDPSATRTEANVLPKPLTIIEQRSKGTDRLGSDRDVTAGSYLQRFTQARRIYQSNISSKEKGWGQQASNQPKKLNKFVSYQHLKMEGLHCLKVLLQNGDMCKIDLKNGYFSVPLSKVSRKLVRFQWEGYLPEFLCLCFGLGPAPGAFTKLFKIPMSVLMRLMIGAIIFLDDLLIFENTMDEILVARGSVIFLLQHLGFLINFKKCVLEPTQETLSGYDCELKDNDIVFTSGKG